MKPRALSTSTILAAVGGTVLLLGIVFLLILAAQAGFFGPGPRVITAALVAIGLIGGGIYLRSKPETSDRRRNSNEAGALALVGTGYAAAILDVIAATSLYHFLPTLLGYVVVGLLAAAGLVLAYMWRSDILAALAGCGAMVFAPLLSVDAKTIVFVTIIGATMTITGHRHHHWLRFLRTIVPAAFIGISLPASHFAESIMSESYTADIVTYGLCAVVFAIIVMATTVVESVVSAREGDLFAMVNLPAVFPLAFLATADFPLPTWLVYALLGALYSAVAVAVVYMYFATKRSVVSVGAVLGILGVLFFAMALARTRGSFRELSVTATAIAYLILAQRVRRRWLRVVAGLAVAVAVVVFLGSADVQYMFWRSAAVSTYTWIDALNSVAMLCGIAVFAYYLRTTSSQQSVRTVRPFLVAAAIIVASLTVIIVGVATGRGLGGQESVATGFFTAHLIVTVALISLAAVLVLTDAIPVSKPRTVGFALGGVALAKLFLFDLSMLPAVLRIIAFLIVGGVLLLVSLRYTDPDPTATANPSPGMSPPPTAAADTAHHAPHSGYGGHNRSAYDGPVPPGPGPAGNSGQMY